MGEDALKPDQRGVVRQSHTRLKVTQPHKPSKRRFGPTQWEHHCIFVYKSVRF